MDYIRFLNISFVRLLFLAYFCQDSSTGPQTSNLQVSSRMHQFMDFVSHNMAA